MGTNKRLQLVAGCVIVLIWFTACTAKNSSAVISPSSPTSTLVTLSGTDIPSIPAPKAADLRSMILESFNKQDAFSWRYHSTTVLANGEIHTTLVEYQPSQRYQIVSDAKSGLIIIDKKVYTRQGDQWVLAQIPIENIIDPKAAQRLEKSIKDIIYIGSEYLDEKAMLVCRYNTLQKTGETETATEVTLWLGNEDRLPYKMLVKGQTLVIDGQTGEVKGIDSTSTVLFEYDPSIEIALPAIP